MWEDNQILSTYRNLLCLQHWCQQRDVIPLRVLLGVAAFFSKYSWPPVGYSPAGIFPGMSTDDLGFRPWSPPSSVCKLGNCDAFLGSGSQCICHLLPPLSSSHSSSSPPLPRGSLPGLQSPGDPAHLFTHLTL